MKFCWAELCPNSLSTTPQLILTVIGESCIPTNTSFWPQVAWSKETNYFHEYGESNLICSSLNSTNIIFSIEVRLLVKELTSCGKLNALAYNDVIIFGRLRNGITWILWFSRTVGFKFFLTHSLNTTCYQNKLSYMN